jgi:hypothetical protein
MRGNRAGKIFFIASFLAFALAVLSFPSPPILRDYPDWVYQGVLLAKTLTGHPVAGYALKPYPVPNSMTTVGLGLLTVAFGWQLAAKLWVIVYLALAAVTSLYAGSVFGVKDSGLWWVLPVTLFLGQLFWFGTISFNIGLCFLLVLTCLLYRRQERVALIAALLVTCFFVHMIVYASAMLMIFLYCLQYRRWKLTYVGIATVPLVVWYFAGRMLTHSNESEYGYSPASHVALPCVVTLVVLALGFFGRKRSIQRVFGPVLVFLSVAIAAGALISAFFPVAHLSARALSKIFVLQLKALQPFMLFGFVNMVHTQIGHRLFSSTLHLLHEPLFLVLMVADVLVGVAIIGDIARLLMARRGVSGIGVDESTDAANFLWDFITLFGLLYIVCPPNALGVISIDMRLAQIGLAPALFLLARRPKTVLRFASLPCALLLASSMYQFGVSQHRVRLVETEMNLPHVLDYFGAVDPIVSLTEYDTIRSGQLDHWIFSTGIFVETSSHPH